MRRILTIFVSIILIIIEIILMTVLMPIAIVGISIETIWNEFFLPCWRGENTIKSAIIEMFKQFIQSVEGK